MDKEIFNKIVVSELITEIMTTTEKKSTDAKIKALMKGERTETNMLTRGIVRELLLNAINYKDYATGCEKYISMLRYGQYGQVGVMEFGERKNLKMIIWKMKRVLKQD